jgi:hypothetical protein
MSYYDWDEDYDDESEFGTCETCGGEFWPGGSSCDCDQPHCVDCGDQSVDTCNCCGSDLCPQCFECGSGFCTVCLKDPNFSERMAEAYAAMYDTLPAESNQPETV